MPQEEFSRTEESSRPLETPETFNSIAEARDFFENQSRKCVHEYHRTLKRVPPDAVEATSNFLLQEYAFLLEKFTAAMTRFEQSRGSSLTNKERMGMKILKIYQLRHTFLFGAANFKRTGVENWDIFNPMFEEIVSLAASIVEITTYETESAHSMSPGSSSPKGGTTRLKPSFSLDNGVIAPLYDVATLCRDPILRRRAVHLLRSARRREGVFNSQLCAIVAEKIIAVEEAAATQAEGFDDDINNLESLMKNMFLGTTKQESQEHNQIKKSSEVPSAVRLTYAYPRSDVDNEKVVLIVGQETKMHLNSPMPDMTAMLIWDDFLLPLSNGRRIKCIYWYEREIIYLRCVLYPAMR
jgi:hypothetical protein